MRTQQTYRRFRHDAKGLRRKRVRVLQDIPMDSQGWPADLSKGSTDVIVVGDEPSVYLNVRVHLIGEPDRIELVKFDQLALYDE